MKLYEIKRICFQIFETPLDMRHEIFARKIFGRLHETAPDAHAAIEVGIGRLRVGLTFSAVDPAGAVALATAAARTVFGRSASVITVEPAERLV